jgi:hypothetical protein
VIALTYIAFIGVAWGIAKFIRIVDERSPHE